MDSLANVIPALKAAELHLPGPRDHAEYRTRPMQRDCGKGRLISRPGVGTGSNQRRRRISSTKFPAKARRKFVQFAGGVRFAQSTGRAGCVSTSGGSRRESENIKMKASTDGGNQFQMIHPPGTQLPPAGPQWNPRSIRFATNPVARRKKARYEWCGFAPHILQLAPGSQNQSAGRIRLSQQKLSPAGEEDFRSVPRREAGT